MPLIIFQIHQNSFLKYQNKYNQKNQNKNNKIHLYVGSSWVKLVEKIIILNSTQSEA